MLNSSGASSDNSGSRGLADQDIVLETARMILRRLTEADADNLFSLDSDPGVMRYLTGGVPSTRAFIVEQSLPMMLGLYEQFDGFGFWAAIEKTSDDFMGWFHFRPDRNHPEDADLGYRLKKPYWGCGLATEGSRALIDRGFRELGVTKVVAEAMSQNVRSRRVLEKCGLVLEKTFAYPGAPFPGWRPEDCLEVRYGLTRKRWEIARVSGDVGIVHTHPLIHKDSASD